MVEPIEECFIFLLSKANQRVQALTKERLAGFGVTPTQYALLRVLWETDGLSGAELGQRLKLDAATVTGLLDRLETAGFLERQPHPEDRRVNLVFLSKKGRSLRKPLMDEVHRISAEVEARFSAKDMRRLRLALTELGEVAAPLEAR